MRTKSAALLAVTFIVAAAAAAATVALVAAPGSAGSAAKPDLWDVYQHSLRQARYIDLTHSITPNMPVWKGFGPATFSPTVDPATGQPYTYAKDGFEATNVTA